MVFAGFYCCQIILYYIMGLWTIKILSNVDAFSQGYRVQSLSLKTKKGRSIK